MTPDPVPEHTGRRTRALPRRRFMRGITVLRSGSTFTVVQSVEAEPRHASTVHEMRVIIAAQAKRDRKAARRRQS